PDPQSPDKQSTTVSLKRYMGEDGCTRNPCVSHIETMHGLKKGIQSRGGDLFSRDSVSLLRIEVPIREHWKRGPVCIVLRNAAFQTKHAKTGNTKGLFKDGVLCGFTCWTSRVRCMS